MTLITTASFSTGMVTTTGIVSTTGTKSTTGKFLTRGGWNQAARAKIDVDTTKICGTVGIGNKM